MDEKKTHANDRSARETSRDNRRINWMIMMQAWKAFKEDGGYQEFHKALGINKNAYYNVQLGERVSEKLCARVEEKTGIKADILLGKKLLELSGFTEEKIKKYNEICEVLGASANEKEKEEEKNCRKKKKDICEEVQTLLKRQQDIYSDSELSHVLFYFKYGTKRSEKAKEIEFRSNVEKLKKIEWDDLVVISENVLDNYKRALHYQEKLVEAVLTYKEEKKKQKKKEKHRKKGE